MKYMIAVLGVFFSLWGGTGKALADITPESQLMVTDLRVVEDSRRTDPERGRGAVWSFRYLIEQMAGDNDPAEFVLNWLTQWETDQVVNGHVAAARPAVRELIIDPWLAASGGERLDLNKAPFKLLAIVNRLDMREHTATDELISAGEGRFVFGVLDAEGQPLPPTAGPATGGFTVILEYGLPATNMRDLGRWAQDWAGLERHRLGSREYLDALERITRRFTDRGRSPEKPNRSPLNQIRTNEIALDFTWELREFVIDASSGHLQQQSVALTPDSIQLNGTADLASLLNNQQRNILNNNFTFPAWRQAASSIAGPFLPAHFVDFDTRSFTKKRLIEGLDFYDVPWSAAETVDNEVRHRFALNTCNGCHRDETTTDFLHVGFPEVHQLPDSLGNPAALSAFLTGGEAVDPVDAGTLREFAELDRRKTDLQELVASFGADGRDRGPRRAQRPRFPH